MGDFNRRGTSVNKIMSYDRYHMKKIFTAISCEESADFNLYFRFNISSGNLYNTFRILSLEQQKEILKTFLSISYNVPKERIIIISVRIGSIEFSVRFLNSPQYLMDLNLNPQSVVDNLLFSTNTVLNTNFTEDDLQDNFSLVYDNTELEQEQEPEPLEPEPEPLEPEPEPLEPEPEPLEPEPVS